MEHKPKKKVIIQENIAWMLRAFKAAFELLLIKPSKNKSKGKMWKIIKF